MLGNMLNKKISLKEYLDMMGNMDCIDRAGLNPKIRQFIVDNIKQVKEVTHGHSETKGRLA